MSAAIPIEYGPSSTTMSLCTICYIYLPSSLPVYLCTSPHSMKGLFIGLSFAIKGLFEFLFSASIFFGFVIEKPYL